MSPKTPHRPPPVEAVGPIRPFADHDTAAGGRLCPVDLIVAAVAGMVWR